jgi:TolB-like protein/tetratricopeptide (TPR) repeat protein
VRGLLGAGTLILAAAAAPLAAQCPDGTPAPCPGARVAPNSVAVLYFDNLSSDSGDAVLADGLTEEIIVRLRRLERLDVKPRSAVLRFRGQSVAPEAAARVLAVGHLVSGQVRRVGTRVRVTAELVRVQGEQLVWSTSYVRPVSDAFDLSAEIAESVAVAVGGRMLPAERAQVSSRSTRSEEAYRHYVSGNTYLTRRSRMGIRRAVEEYRAAIGADPRFAAAYARLSLTYALSAMWEYEFEGLGARELAPAARQAAAQAVRLDSTSSEAWLATAMVRHIDEPLDPSGARAAFERSVALNPANAEAVHQYAGRLFEWRRPEALATERRSAAIDPAQPTTLNNLAWELKHDGDLAGALVLMDSAVSVEPDYPMGLLYRGILRAAHADSAGALADLAAAQRRLPGEWLAQAAAGFAALLRGDTATAIVAARAWDAFMQPWYAAGIGNSVYLGPDDLWVAAGRRGEAMDCWERQPRSAKRYWNMRDAAARDPVLAGDPRFQRLLAATAPPPEYR